MKFNYKKVFKNKEIRLKILDLLQFVPDKQMCQLQFRIIMGRKLNLNNPKTFNEKLQWLKIYDHNDLHIKLADKYCVRKYVSKVLGDEYLIPLLGKWEKYEDIDFEELPSKFVLKCNHDSGSVRIINDKNKINHKELAKFFDDRLKNNPYSYGREWPYKRIKPCIIAEKNMCDKSGETPVDYKFFCFAGNVDSVMICIGRGTNEKRFYFFDKNWRLRKYNKSSQNLPDNFQIEKPKEIEKMFQLASELSAKEAFVRIDFYLIDERPYFGEFTYYPASGFDYNLVRWADEYLGDLIDLNVVKDKRRK